MKRFKFLFIILLICLFTNQVNAQVPDIVKVDKISGTYRELVTISGSGFSENKSDLSVHFGSSKGQIINSKEYTIEVFAPAGATYDNISVTNHKSRLTGYAKNNFNLAFNGKGFEESRIIESSTIKEDIELFDMCNCDFNGDGLNDVAVTNNTDDISTNSITVYQNITQASEYDIKFQKINGINLNTGKGARNITCGDLDGDGKPELVVGKGGGNADRIYIFKNISTAGIRFDPFITILLSENVSSSTTRNLKIHDLDNDGKPDIIMTDQSAGKLYIFGNKSTQNAIDFPSEARQSIQTSAGSLVGLDVADLNGDNKPEIVCNSDKSEIFIFPNQSVPGAIRMGTPQTKTIAGANLVNLKIGDLDNDGDKDIVITNLVNNIYILINGGNADNFSFLTTKYIETGRAPWGLDFGDLNGDGRVDIVVGTTDASDKLTALLNISSGNNISFIPYNIGNADISFNLNISDFNGDAKPDIGYINRKDNKLTFLRNTHCVIAEILPKNPAPICSNKPVKLKTTPALKVTYTWTNMTTDQVVAGDYTTEITQIGSYNVSIESQNEGCQSISNEVTVRDGGDNLPPSVAVTSPGVVCEGSNFTITAELVGDVKYTWRTPRGVIIDENEITISNASIEDAGRYSLILESLGCKSDPIIELIEISSIPILEISSTAGELFCEGTPNELSVPYIPQSIYQWKLNNNIISDVTGNTHSTTESGTYLVSVQNSHACTETSSSISIKEVLQPTALFGDITSSCLNEQIQFENNSTYDETETVIFTWDLGDGTTSNKKNPAHRYSNAGDFIVSLKVGYKNTSCNDSYETTITVAEFLNLEIMADGMSVPDGIFNLCEGSSGELSVNANPGQVEWNTGETTPRITISEAGIYSVISGSNTGCSSSDEIETVIVDDINLVITSGSQRIESGNSAQLVAEGAVFYAWEPVEDLDDATIPNPIASPLETTEYMVTGTNSFGCEGWGEVTVYVDEKITIAVDAPKAFSPNNGDAINNEWEIVNIDVFESCPIRIFNRRGQTVYEASRYNNDWDGTLNGSNLPEGAYYYILTCSASEVHTGSIAIIR